MKDPERHVTQDLLNPSLARPALGFKLEGVSRFSVSIFLIALSFHGITGCTSAPKGDATLPPTTVMTRFYDSYFRAGETSLPAPAFSEEFSELLNENFEVCREMASPGDVCGFGADVDPFLDAREEKGKLNLESSAFQAKDTGPGVVEVEFDLRPPERSHYHHRKIRYVMKVENGRWVIDDIVYGTRSARSQMMTEIQQLRSTIF